MSNQLIETEKELLPEEVRKFIDPQGQGTDQEHKFFLELCKARKLNPFVKDVYFIKYGSMQAATVIAVDTFVARSMDHSNYEGYEAGWIVGPEDTPKRTVDPFGYLMGAWCRVMRTGMVPCEVALRFDAFSTGKNRWKSDPFGMIQKCAIAAAHRKAFPKTFAHLYGQEEITNPNEKDKPKNKKPIKPKTKKGLEGLQESIDNNKDLSDSNKTDISFDSPDTIESEEFELAQLSSNILDNTINQLNTIIGLDLTKATQDEIMILQDKIKEENGESYDNWVKAVNEGVEEWEKEMTPDDYNSLKEYCLEIQKHFKPEGNYES
tara:strand:- start:1094 stop:2056 length:963 start_codon:yes stop_codon:yes gene_type:complete